MSNFDPAVRSDMLAIATSVLLAAQPTIMPVPTRTYRSIGELKCATWTSSRAKQTTDAQLIVAAGRLWIKAYLTAFNIYGPDRSRDILFDAPFAEVEDRVDRYCVGQPRANITAAMPDTIAYLSRRKLNRSPGQ